MRVSICSPHNRSTGLRTPMVPVEDMGIDHRGFDIGVAQQLLNRTDVVAGFVGIDLAQQEFEGDFSLQLWIFGQIHYSHSTFTDLFKNLVTGDSFADHHFSILVNG